MKAALYLFQTLTAVMLLSGDDFREQAQYKVIYSCSSVCFLVQRAALPSLVMVWAPLIHCV